MIGSPLFSCVVYDSENERIFSNGKIYTELHNLRSQVVDSMRSRLVFVLPLLF